VKVPLLVELLEHPWMSSIPSNGGLDAPAVLMSRPRPSFPRHPAKGNAFPKAGMPSTLRNLDGVKIAPHTTWTGNHHYAAALRA
jgi:hypothetical protein